MASAISGSKIDIDDTQPLTSFILGTETEEDHVVLVQENESSLNRLVLTHHVFKVYIIKVQRGIDSKYSWVIKKRYNEFNELHTELKQANYELPMPPKKVFGNMKREFLSTRQIGLQVRFN